MRQEDRYSTACATGAKITFIHGACPLRIRGESLETSTTLSIDPTICVAAQMRQILIVSLRAAIALFSISSIKSLRTLIEGCMADGTIWTCWKLAGAA